MLFTGCGIVDPKWMQLSNGTFVNTSRVTTPVYTGTVDTFLIMGLQPNYWLQENTTGRFVGFYQVIVLLYLHIHSPAPVAAPCTGPYSAL